MVLTDFIYDGSCLSDYGCIIGSISSSSNSEETQLGTERDLNTVKIKEESHIATSTFEDVCTASFDLIPDFCNGKQYFTDDEVYRINTWLSQGKYKLFKPLYDDDSFADLQFKAIFTTVSAIKVGGRIMGFHAEMKTNKPYGFSIKNIKKKLTSANNSFLLLNDSQESGHLYPTELKITCNEAGNLIISNNKDNNGEYKTIINNCIVGEIITIDGEHEIISSSEPHSGIWNDFNYQFFRLIKEGTNDTPNIITFEGIKDVDINMTYESIRRTGIII